MMSDLQVRIGLRPGFGHQPDVGPEATLEQQAPEAVDTVADHADGARRTAPRMPMIGIQRLGRRPQIAWINPLVIQSNLDKVHESNQLRSSENPPNQYPQLRQERNTKKEGCNGKPCNWSVVGATTWSSDATTVARPHTWMQRETFPPRWRVAPANVDLLWTVRNGRRLKPIRWDLHTGRSPYVLTIVTWI